MMIMFLYLYSVPTVDEFFDGIEATLAIKAFNSPIAFPGFKPFGQALVQFIIV